MDEPTSFLDSKNAYLIMMVLEKIVEKTDTIVLLATHDQRIMKKEYVNFCIDDKKIVKDKICDNKINENEKPDFYLTQKAYKKYAKITQRKNSYLNCIFLTFFISRHGRENTKAKRPQRTKILCSLIFYSGHLISLQA